MTTLTALRAAQTSLLIKPLDAAVFVAPYGTVTIPSAFTSTSSVLQPLPAGFLSVGLIDKKSGIAFARSTTNAPIESYGFLQPTRDDITEDLTTIEFEAQESARAAVLQLTTSANISAITANSSSGEVFIPQPANEQITYYTMIVIGKDGTDASPTYIFKVAPRVAITKYNGEQWTPTTLASQKLTATAFFDSVTGYAIAHGYGGPGWTSKLINTGIAYTVTSITVTPATLSVSHTAGAQPALVVMDQFGAVIPNGASSATFTSGTPATCTIGANTGVITPVAAGSSIITATFTPQGGSPLTATMTVTCT